MNYNIGQKVILTQSLEEIYPNCEGLCGNIVDIQLMTNQRYNIQNTYYFVNFKDIDTLILSDGEFLGLDDSRDKKIKGILRY